MKQLLSLFILFFVLLSCSDEIDHEQSDLISKIFPEIYISGETGLYIDKSGEPVDGHYTLAFEDGTDQADLIFENGSVLNGTLWRKEGTIYTTYATENNRTVWTSYTENEIQNFRFVYEDDKSSPLKTSTWYEDGTPKLEITQTRSRMWHKNGQLQSEIELVDGKMHGKGLHWHENGEIAGETHYKDDQWHGTFKKWDEQGNLISEKVYDMGIPVSEDEI